MGLRERFEQITEAWNAHQFDGVVTAVSEDCEVTAPDFTGQGHQGLRDWWDYNEGPFPDNQVVVHRPFWRATRWSRNRRSAAPTLGRCPAPTARRSRRPETASRSRTSRSTPPAGTRSSAGCRTGARWR